jgi:hypothetical protein
VVFITHPLGITLVQLKFELNVIFDHDIQNSAHPLEFRHRVVSQIHLHNPIFTLVELGLALDFQQSLVLRLIEKDILFVFQELFFYLAQLEPKSFVFIEHFL